VADCESLLDSATKHFENLDNVHVKDSGSDLGTNSNWLQFKFRSVAYVLNFQFRRFF